MHLGINKTVEGINKLYRVPAKWRERLEIRDTLKSRPKTDSLTCSQLDSKFHQRRWYFDQIITLVSSHNHRNNEIRSLIL